ncbi:hypothetical protein D6829_00725 [Candidatus Pacearchaeota archaeon]|nr:MAG: hypothetical protein D6829_00725 [Candidatus Pacearchaeota archaeon]
MDLRRLTILTALLVVLSVAGVLALPFGAQTTVVNSERSPADTPSSDGALAGNVTELTITGYSVTQTWQGYFGNVSGTIQLTDANDNVFYNWSVSSPQGEVYASTNDSIAWSYVQCFNFTADGTYADDTAQAGATSLHGKNLTQLESEFNISSRDVDGVNETFSINGTHESGGGFNHSLFYTNSLEFSQGECLSTHIRGNNGAITDANFEEVLLYEPTTRAVIFTALLDEDVLGFDGKSHDFEMLVLEDGHGTDTATTTYYFYVELE